MLLFLWGKIGGKSSGWGWQPLAEIVISADTIQGLSAQVINSIAFSQGEVGLIQLNHLACGKTILCSVVECFQDHLVLSGVMAEAEW